MTTPPSLPSLPGLGWSRHKKPGFSTRVAAHVSGREVRVPLMSYPLYEFEATYCGLSSAAVPPSAQAGLGTSSLQSLMGLFLQLQGQFGTFLYSDPDDNAVTEQMIGVGDGATQSFVLSRTLGGWNEPVSWVTSVANVYLDGAAQASDTWALLAPNSVAFGAAPGAGVIITASFSYAFQCRFLEDDLDFEEFMSGLWKLGSMKFRSVKVNSMAAAVPAPTVTAISPSSGSTSGGASVTVTGTFFGGTTSVTIGGVACTDVAVVNSTTITATTGANSGGVDNVVVTTPSGAGTGAALYTYTAWYTPYAIDGTTPTLFADTTTEGSTNNYLYNGTAYGSFAALLTALGITFTQAGTPYFTNASGVLTGASANTPRFDYDPVALTLKGILLEGASTNLLTYSQTFASWTTFGMVTVTAGSATAPDGTTTAALITMGSYGSNEYQLVKTPSGGIAGTTVQAFSAYLKPGTARYVSLQMYAGAYGNIGAVFDLGSNNAAATQTHSATATLISTSQEPAANGFYRVSITFSVSATDSGGFVGLNPTPAATGNTFGGDGGITANVADLTFYAWGAQFEALPFVSSYIPTTSSTASRAADSLSAATWPALAAGTLYAKADTFGPSQAQRIIQIDDGTANNRATLEFTASAAGEFDFLVGGVSEAALTAGTVTANTAAQLAAAFQANDFALVVGGGTPSTASSGGAPSFSKLRLGVDTSGGTNLFGHLAQIGVWNGLRGPNANLQSLT